MRLIPNNEQVFAPSTSENLEETGFLDNWGASLGLTMSEDLPVTSRFLPTEVESSRKKKIHDYLESGDIPYSAAMFYGNDLSGLAGYARDKLGLEGFFTDEEYQEQRKQEYGDRRSYSQSVFDKANWLGKIGQIAGTAHAMALDPIYAVSALTGYGTAATIGRAVLVTAATEAGIEAVAQPFKMSFKEEIGADYGAAQALTEIAFAGIGSGLLAGAGKAASKWLGKTFGPADISVRDAIEVFESMKAPEMEPVLNTLRHADPDANLLKVLTEDEAIDIRRANEGPPRIAEADEFFDRIGKEEDMFLARQPMEPVKTEGVPRGTPAPKKEPDLRHPLVVEADDEVHYITSVLEDCF